LGLWKKEEESILLMDMIALALYIDLFFLFLFLFFGGGGMNYVALVALRENFRQKIELKCQS
jgi:hypothetical protein